MQEGNTALIEAAGAGYPMAVTDLINAGANVHRANNVRVCHD